MEELGWSGTMVSGNLAEVAKERYKVHCHPFYARFFNATLGALRDVEHVLRAKRV